MAKFVKGKKTGMVMKVAKKKGGSMVSRAKPSDIKGMSTKNKIKFGTAIKAGGKGKLRGIARKIKSKKR